MTGVQSVSHLGPFRDGDPAYALALPIEYVAVVSEIAAEPAPVYDDLVAEPEWAHLIGAEPATGGYCDACGHPVGYHDSGACSMPLGPSGLPHGRNEPCAGSCACTAAVRSRAYWTTGPGSQRDGLIEAISRPPIVPPGTRDTCSLCGRDTALRRDGSFVRHNNPATNEPCVGFNSPPRDASGRFLDGR